MSEAFLNSGVPEAVFQDGFNGAVTLAGGTLLRCEISQERVSMVDLNYVDKSGTPCYLFAAKVMQDADTDSHTMEMVIRTEHAEAQVKKHPDLRAAALLDRTIRYFDEQRPQPLTHFLACWDDSPHLATNYRYFRNEVDRLAALGPVSDAQLGSVALATWTGREVRKHGFHTLEYVSDNIEEVTARFVRDQSLV